MNQFITWDDNSYIWNGDQNYTWDNASIIVNNVQASLEDWYIPRTWEATKKKLQPSIAKEFLEVIIRVNGITQTYKREKEEKPNITIENIQKTFKHFSSNKVSVKAQITKI